jgi:serine/threonine protein kinase
LRRSENSLPSRNNDAALRVPGESRDYGHRLVLLFLPPFNFDSAPTISWTGNRLSFIQTFRTQFSLNTFPSPFISQPSSTSNSFFPPESLDAILRTPRPLPRLNFQSVPIVRRSLKSMEIPPGTSIGDYVIQEQIGKGGFSIVYKVSCARFGSEFAAKVLQRDPDQSMRSRNSYENELQILMNLNHPNIVLLYDAFHHNGCPILILEYCPRGTLEDEVKATAGHGLPIPRFNSIAEQLLNALSFCHARGIAHRDIKPSNILIDQYGRPKLTDFGIAEMGHHAWDQPAEASLAFAAPELLDGAPSDRTKADIWALGVTFAFCLDAAHPFPKDPVQRRKAITVGSFLIRRAIPVQLSHLLKKMICPEPDVRASADQLIQHGYFTAGAFRRSTSVLGQSSFIRTARSTFTGWTPIHSSIAGSFTGARRWSEGSGLLTLDLVESAREAPDAPLAHGHV